MSVPSSVIHILSGVPLNNSYEHTLWFESEDMQKIYMLGKKSKTLSNYTYLRPGNIIKVAGDVANARSWSYLMFQNDAGKWYYHFITQVVYLNDSAVELHIELDVIQTFMFDWELHPCFIERTHTATDEFGEHTIPEGLETGPLVRYSTQEINLEDNVILVMMSCDSSGNNAWGQMYGGVYSGLAVYAVLPGKVSAFNTWLETASSEGFVDAIVSMWMYPKELVTISDVWTSDALFHTVINVNGTQDVTVEDPITTAIDGYYVENKKTLCYPYTMLYMSNNLGGCAVYHRERFTTEGDYTFRLLGALAPDSGVQLIPNSYKSVTGSTLNFEESLSLPAFPTCAWNSDTYKVWLAQNQNTMANQQKQAIIQAGAGAVASIASAATGNLMGAVGGLGATYNAFTQVQNLMAQKADMAIQPDQARGAHSGNINLTHGHMGFSAHFMTITAEYARVIDKYFSRYGYQVNTVAVPSLHNRLVFTYVKTAGAYVTGTFGAEDQLKIQSILDKGVTFWAKPALVGAVDTPNPTLE